MTKTTTGTTLAELGYTGGNGTITLTKGDGTKKTIEVSQGTTVNVLYQFFERSRRECKL